MKHAIYILFMTSLFTARTAAANGYVFFSEIMYDTPLNELITVRPYSNGEFIKLYNAGHAPLNIGGWLLSGEGKTERFIFPDTSVPAQSTLIVAYRNSSSPDFELEDLFPGILSSPNTSIIYQNKVVLANTKEALLLHDDTGSLRDSIYYGNMTGIKPVSARLIAENEDSISGGECLSVQRKRINYDEASCGIANHLDWEVSLVNTTGSSGVALIEPAIPEPHGISADQNYIVTVIPTVASSSVNITETGIGVSGGAAMVSVQYYDGLGRPGQLVQKGVSPSGADLTSLMEYDAFGREYRQWLPAPVSGNDGAYVSGMTAAASAYYGDAAPYAETLLEQSPLNRTTGVKSPGSGFQTHPTNVAYETNAVNEVKYFYTDMNMNLQYAGYYVAGTLYKTTQRDEDGKTNAEYKDMLGRVVMTRQSANHDTYYAYDDFGNLCFVLPPLAADQLTSQGTYGDNTSCLKQYAYVYRYDHRNRCIQKRLPGCEWTYMIYDKADHLILTQDGNQRAQIDSQQRNKWTLYKYDKLGREIYTMEIVMKGTVAGLADYFNQYVVTESFMDAAAQTYPAGDSGYSRGWYHLVPMRLLTVNYYDNYDFLELPAYNSQKLQLNYAEKQNYGTKYENAKGLLTGTRTYLLDGSGGYLTGVYYYDYRGRTIQTRSTNHLNGYDMVYNAYDFMGNPVRTLKEHSATDYTLTTTPNIHVSETYTFTYDHAGRPLETRYKIMDNPEIVLSKNEYDDLGRLAGKKRHNGADTERYEYNIRNWLTRIQSGGFEEKLYYNTPYPNDPDRTVCYNGNISTATWTYNGKVNGYIYRYDGLNRLTSTHSILNNQWEDNYYTELFGYDKHGNILSLARWDNQDVMDYLQLIYDGNQLKKVTDGGISQNKYSIKEYQNLANTQTEFLYDANGNMTADLDRNIVTIRYNLLNLPELIQFGNGNQIINHYTADGRKMQTEYLTAKTPLVVPLGNTVELAVSNRWRSGVAYAGNYEYDISNDGKFLLSRILNSEGYVSFSPNMDDDVYYYKYDKYLYNYYRKDHLGNNHEVWRVSYMEYVFNHDSQTWDIGRQMSDSTIQRTQYYPSGLPWESNAGDNPYVQPNKYNGKEFVEMHGYDVTDLGNRGVYNAVNRFTSIDRFAEKFPWQSPYVHAGNNPVKYVDVNGDSIWINYYDDDGLQQRILYTQEMEYSGDNSIVAQQISSLNAMNNTKKGNVVLSALSSSQNNFNVTNGNSADGTAGFKRNSTGGGDLLMNNNNDLLSMSHKMFHAYQHENGQGGASIFNEIEAYLFSDGVNLEYNGGMGAGGSYSEGQSSSKEAMTYSNALNDLLFNSVFPEKSFNTAVNLFKNNSGANSDGMYNNYPLRRNNQRRNLIKSFYPLYK